MEPDTNVQRYQQEKRQKRELGLLLTGLPSVILSAKRARCTVPLGGAGLPDSSTNANNAVELGELGEPWLSACRAA